MTGPSRYKGIASLDALLSLVPIMLIIFLLASSSSSLMRNAESVSHRQQAFDKIVSVADYTVKIGAARHDGSIRHPNWVDPGLITPEYSESMRVRSGLSSIFIGLEEPETGYPICIYRLVVTGDEKAIERLHVCGG